MTIWNCFFSASLIIIDSAKSHSDANIDGVTKDMSTFAGEIACVIAGHSHYDDSLQTEQGIWVINTTCDRGPKSDSSGAFKAIRAIGTINEQAIDVFLIDTSAKTINTIRIGGSYTYSGIPLENPDRSFSYGT